MDRNLNALVSSNVAPTDVEIRQIRELFERKSADITAVEHEVSAYITALDSLVRRRNRLRGERHTVGTVLPHIRTFPVEIILEIFYHCLRNSLSTTGYSTTNPLEAPLLLGQICSTWRAISHSAPRLWTQIHSKLPHLNRNPDPLLRELILRSRKLPLSLTLAAADPPHNSPRWAVPTPSLSTITSLSMRIERLSLQLGIREFTKPRSDVRFPLLRSLKIEIHDDSESCIGALLHVLHFAPRLRHLDVTARRAFLPSFSMLDVKLPWDHLTKLQLNFLLDPPTATRLLGRCVRLHSCSLDIKRTVAPERYDSDVEEEEEDEDEEELTSIPLRVLPNLQSLTLISSSHYPTSVSFIVTRFSLSNLTHLKVDAIKWSITHLVDLYHRSLFKLKCLVLKVPFNRTWRRINPVSLLRLLPTLKSIEITGLATQNTLFEAFDPTRTDRLDLAHLKFLLIGGDADRLNDELVASFLESLNNVSTSDGLDGHMGARPYPQLARVDLEFIGRAFNPNVEKRLEKICYKH